MQTVIPLAPHAIKYTLHKTKFVIELLKQKYALHVIKSSALKSIDPHDTLFVRGKWCARIVITLMDQQDQAKWLEIV